MGKFINPFTDFGFHRIFGQEVHKELLIDFLNQLFFGEHYIEDITFLNPIQTPETLDDRGLYYLARAISNQGQKGKDWKFVLQPVYGVFLLNYKMDVNSKFRTDVILADRETGRMFSDRIRQVYLELPYFQKEPDECENDFERWIYLLKHMDTLERMPFKAKKAVFDKLLEVADVANLSKEERIQYDEALKRYRDYKNTIDYAEEKGILKGKESTARNMKADGLSHSIIQKYTGLSLEDIDKL